jgi:hypothetical protein
VKPWDMTTNPYQDVIDWLNSDEGYRWSLSNHDQHYFVLAEKIDQADMLCAFDDIGSYWIWDIPKSVG